MSTPYQHIDLRVNDIELAWKFYAKILPPIGFFEDPFGNRLEVCHR